MKKFVIILFSLFITYAAHTQSTNYETKWKQVAELSKNKKSKDAEAVIRNIMELAKKENNTEQRIKSLIFLRQAVAERDEKDDSNTIQDFEKEIKGLPFPEKSIMHSMIASLYYSYYQDHRWEIYGRTEVTNPTDLKYPADIATWTPQLFFNKIQEQFDASLQNTKSLQTYPITAFPELIKKGVHTSKLHPTLFDVLVHRAINYYRLEEIDISKAAYYFKLKDKEAFSNASEFSSHVFQTKDNFSTKYIALTYFQLATRYHLKDKTPDALIDLESNRLQFISNHFDGKKGDEKYREALKSLIRKYPNNIATAKPIYLLAKSLQQTDKSEALKWTAKIKERFPKSYELVLAKNLERQIKEKLLSLSTEKADLPGKNILGKITFQNIEHVYFKIVRLSYTREQKRGWNYNASSKIPEGELIREWNVALQHKNWKNKPYDLHETEVLIEKLPPGNFAIIASGSSSFDSKKAPISFTQFQTTPISYVVRDLDNGSSLYVLHRETGRPIQGARVSRFSDFFSTPKQSYIRKKVDTKQTDANGHIYFDNPSKKGYHSYDIEIEYRDDKLWINSAFSTNRSVEYADDKKLFLFTDRAIYRPGQTIYFKGIYLNLDQDGKKHQTIPTQEIEVRLRDPNYKEVKKLKLVTNEFGSINGSFEAPEGLLNGRYTITTDYGRHTIRVEEYKRPKFEVNMDSLTKNVQLGDQITVSGHAKAYAGHAIDGGKVKYIVRRKVRWPYYWCSYYWDAPSGDQDIVLTQGEAVTDEEGKFEVSFLAEGDKNIDVRTKPFYDFLVSADVTDMNGEVRSGSMSYAISNESLLVTLSMAEEIDFNKFNHLKVNTTNIQGTFTPTDIKLSFIKLKEPNHFLKKRKWESPKENMLTQADFSKHFPDYEYKNESNTLFWPEVKTIWTKNVRTKKGQNITLQKVAPNGGYYLIKVTARDRKGRLVEEKKVVRLINNSTHQARSNEALFTYLPKKVLEPGDKASPSVSSAFNNAYIHKTVKRQGQQTKTWSNKAERYIINEADRGGFLVNYFMIHGNRLYQKNVYLAVPWSNKDLKISYETFRDKILPGSQQEWKLKISGHKKEKISAEILATMYDASLDAFAKNEWTNLKLYNKNNPYINWNSQAFGLSNIMSTIYEGPARIKTTIIKKYPVLNTYGLFYSDNYYTYTWRESNTSMRAYRGNRYISANSMDVAAEAPGISKARGTYAGSPDTTYAENAITGELQFIITQVVSESAEENKTSTNDVKIRTNMSETAFFFPDLKTDEKGDIIFSFTAPEALTRWNVKALAHTTDLKTAYLEKTLVTQKELMLTPNHPRFMRENDQMVYSSKLTNLSEKDLKGFATLEILNARTNKNISALFGHNTYKKDFELNAGKSEELTWNLHIPEAFTDPVIVRIIAKADGYSDGEQKSIPLLLNSMLVTETIPLAVRANTNKNFHFDKLMKSEKSSTLKHHKLTIEYTTNPAWYAVQALPYLTDYPYECSEQTFNRYYANALAGHIVNSSPKIQKVFSEWKDKDSAALLSNLEKNPELKSALLQETPWVFEAENETAQKRLIAKLFNAHRMSKELRLALKKLGKLQKSNGGFAWFEGMRENQYITQYIVTGIARLQKLGVKDVQSNDKIKSILNKALPYLDDRLVEDYEHLKRKGLLKNKNLGYRQIQYLYMRSFYKNKKMNKATKIAFDYYMAKGKKHWMDYNKYMQGMLALCMNRYNEKSTAQDIMEGLRQNAIYKEEMGMYWKELNQGSYWWYQAPIEAHSLLIEAFKEMPKTGSISSINEVDELRIWLLKQKQTQQWKTTKATADACYALLLGGADWLAAEPVVTIKIGKKNINLKDYKQEAGTGYTKFSFKKDEVKPEMGNIQVSVKAAKNVGTTWGAMYWQYFEQLDKITPAETPLSLTKQIYKVVQGDRGDELVLVTNNDQLSVGDKVKVRIELRVDRKMEFVHMKDMRGACFEPINVLSNYKYQNGLGYYESTKDASTQFFFDYLNPGTYVFEYSMFTTLGGDYSNGVATIQSMYAPEFSSHSEGLRVRVK